MHEQLSTGRSPAELLAPDTRFLQAQKVNFDQFQGLDSDVIKAFKSAQAGKGTSFIL